MSLDIYVMKALGKNGKLLRIPKFQTMHDDADQHLEEVLSRGLNELGKPINDSRITPIGRVLRKYFLDEIPQLCNLVRGELGLVGIRPRPEDFWSFYPSEHKERALRHKPGLMSVRYARTEIRSFDDLVEVEAQYLDEKEKSPLSTDIKYFFKIVYNILFKGVRSK